MKKLFSFLFVLCAMTVHAQTDSTAEISEVNSVWKVDSLHFPLKRGFYKTYQEFLNNAPSLQRDFTINRKSSKEKQEQGTYSVTFDVREGEEKVGKIWGFCDGNIVYAKASPLETRYWRLEYLGPYPYMVHYFQPKSLTQAIVAAASSREFSVFNSSGKCKYAYKDYLEKLFKQCPGLLEEFEKESKPKNEEIQKVYLKRLNEYVALHPELMNE